MKLLLFEILFHWYSFGFAVVIAIVYYLYLQLTRNLNYWTKNGITGPKPIPIFGNMYSYFFQTQFDVELEWYRKYGKIYGFFRGYKPIISVANTELLKQIFVKDFHTFRNRKNAPKTRSLVNKHLAHARDDDWKIQRAIATPAFSSGKLKKMYPLINVCCDEFMSILDEYAKQEKEIELKEYHGAYTMDVIARCAFATNANTYKNPNNEFTKQAKNVFDVKVWKVLLYYIMPSFMGISLRDILNISSKSGDFFEEVGQHLMKQRKASNQKHNDFLQLLIDVEKNDELIGRTDQLAKNHLNEGNDEIKANTNALSDVIEKKLTEKQILAMCYVFFVAGYETSSSVLSFCSYELAINPTIQQKLFEETNKAFDENGKIDYEVLLSLPYLDAVISETLRKWPPVLRLEREAMNDTVLGDTGIKIPKGMAVEIPVIGLHRDPENYPNPEQFIPDRFLPENRSKLKPYTYLPFGMGPRNCIGMRFALLEIKLVLFNIIQRFTLFRTSNTDVPIRIKHNLRIFQSEKIIVGIKRR